MAVAYADRDGFTRDWDVVGVVRAPPTYLIHERLRPGTTSCQTTCAHLCTPITWFGRRG